MEARIVMEMLDGRIARIERALGCRDPGSILQRVTIGEPMKNNVVIAYGHTIAEAMNKADEKTKHRRS
jgi:hypothetical protein